MFSCFPFRSNPVAQDHVDVYQVPYDWYEQYRGSDIQVILRKRLKKDKDIILNVGCGNSRLAEDLYEDGFENVTNIDSSPVVVTQMTAKYGKWMPKLKFYTMNACNLNFEDKTFDVCIDKATLDSILCSVSSGSKQALMRRIHSMFSEISRCMKDDSVYIIISHAPPERRLRLLEFKEYGWSVEVEKIHPEEKLGAIEDRIYYAYICTKGTRHDVPGTGDYRSLS